MYWTTIYTSPCCKADTRKVEDTLAGRHHRVCLKCGKLVSKTRCTKENKAFY